MYNTALSLHHVKLRLALRILMAMTKQIFCNKPPNVASTSVIVLGIAEIQLEWCLNDGPRRLR